MSQLAIRLWRFTICATAFLAVPVLTPADAVAGSRHVHAKKHARHWHHANPWFVGQERPFVSPYAQSGPVCPGIGRSFECKIWPPPFADDPDRKVSKH